MGATLKAAGSRRCNGSVRFTRWIRKAHGWIGLWGALLGLLFGASGIWLNHRTILKLPAGAQQRATMQIALPDSLPATPQAMGRWLQSVLQLEDPALSIRVEPARPVAWAEHTASSPVKQSALTQPEHWSFRFGGPQSIILADAWMGNRSISVRRINNGFLNTLMNLHKGVGMTTAWILLVDTLAGSLLFLSISGVILWVGTSRKRRTGIIILALSAATIAGLIAARL